jgi:hypothetical protein
MRTKKPREEETAKPYGLYRGPLMTLANMRENGVRTLSGALRAVPPRSST